MNQTNRLGVSPDDQAVADAVARFATETLAPRAREIDEHGLSTTCHVPQLAALGVMGMNLPEQLGGAGVTPTAMLLSLGPDGLLIELGYSIGDPENGVQAVQSDVNRAVWASLKAHGVAVTAPTREARRIADAPFAADQSV